jgi:hypothetical protein
MPIPSVKWYPQSLQERAAWFDNLALRFAQVAPGLGFLPADVVIVQTDNTCFQDLASGREQLDAFVEAVTAYRRNVCEGNVGDPTPVFPTAPTITPAELPPTGIFQRLIELVARIRVAPTYTPEIGALLGIIPSSASTSGTGSGTDDGDLKPVLKANAMPGNVVEVKFTRGHTDGIDVEIKVDNAPAWSSGGRFFKSPAALNIPDGTGLPHSVQIRARYLDGNDPVGQNSDTVNVVTTP